MDHPPNPYSLTHSFHTCSNTHTHSLTHSLTHTHTHTLTHTYTHTSGAGKTHTMLGNMENPGVTFLTMMELYRRIDDLRDDKICEVAVSYCEVCGPSMVFVYM